MPFQRRAFNLEHALLGGLLGLILASSPSQAGIRDIGSSIKSVGKSCSLMFPKLLGKGEPKDRDVEQNSKFDRKELRSSLKLGPSALTVENIRQDLIDIHQEFYPNDKIYQYYVKRFAFQVRQIKGIPSDLQEALKKYFFSRAGDKVYADLTWHEAQYPEYLKYVSFDPILKEYLLRQGVQDYYLESPTQDEIQKLVEAYKGILASEEVFKSGEKDQRRRMYLWLWLLGVSSKESESTSFTSGVGLGYTSSSIFIPDYSLFGAHTLALLDRALIQQKIESKSLVSVYNDFRQMKKSLTRWMPGKKLSKLFLPEYFYKKISYRSDKLNIDKSSYVVSVGGITVDNKRTHLIKSFYSIYEDFYRLDEIAHFKKTFDEVIHNIARRSAAKEAAAATSAMVTPPSAAGIVLPPVMIGHLNLGLPEAQGSSHEEPLPSDPVEEVPDLPLAAKKKYKPVNSHDALMLRSRLRLLLPMDQGLGTQDRILSQKIAEKFKTLNSNRAEIAGFSASQVALSHPVSKDDLQQVKKVVGFFGQINDHLMERENVIETMLMTFLTDSSLLMVSGAGTAKSALADHVGRNILKKSTEETSYFSLQMTEQTSLSEIHGGVITKDLDQGIFRRKYEEGVLGSKVVFLDEFFDARMKFIRTLLKSFNERMYTQGKEFYKGVTRVFLAATNHYLNEIYAKNPDSKPEATVDRFGFVVYLPSEFNHIDSILSLNRVGQEEVKSKVFFEDIDAVQDKIDQIKVPSIYALRTSYIYEQMKQRLKRVELQEAAEYKQAIDHGESPLFPYKTTRVFSPRTLGTSLRKIIPAYTYLRQTQAMLKDPSHASSEIKMTSADVDGALDLFYRIQGPSADFLERLAKMDYQRPEELKQIHAVLLEKRTYDEILSELHHEQEKQMQEWKSVLKKRSDLRHRLKEKLSASQRVQVQKDLESVQSSIQSEVNHKLLLLVTIQHPETISAEQIAATETLKVMLEDLNIGSN